MSHSESVRIAWATKTGFCGYGDWFGISDAERLLAWAEHMNKHFAGEIRHWLEYDADENTREGPSLQVLRDDEKLVDANAEDGVDSGGETGIRTLDRLPLRSAATVNRHSPALAHICGPRHRTPAAGPECFSHPHSR